MKFYVKEKLCAGSGADSFQSMLGGDASYEQGKTRILLSGEMTCAGKPRFKPNYIGK